MNRTNSRDQEQEKAIMAWNEIERGTILGCTGFGKTKVGCDIMNDSTATSILVVVPTVALKSTWKEEAEKWGVSKHVSVECTKSIYDKVDQYSCDLLIVDEAHLALGEKYINIFNIPHKKLLCLTATLPHNEGKADLLQEKAPVVYEMAVEEARDKSIVSNFEVYNLAVTMNGKESWLYNKFNIQFLAARAELTSLLNSKFKTYDLFKTASKYSKLKIEQLKDDFEHKLWRASKDYWSGMAMRKKVVQSVDDKFVKAVKIIEKFPDIKWIIFSKKTADVDRLFTLLQKKGINAVKYHSYMKKSEKDFTLENAATADVIVSAEALNTGYNLPTLSGAICLSYTGEPVTFIQSLGRTIRFIEDKKAIYINLYVAGTQEEKWLQSRTTNIKKTFISNIDQIC